MNVNEQEDKFQLFSFVEFFAISVFCTCLEGAEISLVIESVSRFKEPLPDAPALAEIILDSQL